MAPTMVDWLSRSSGSWGFEFADGVLVTAPRRPDRRTRRSSRRSAPTPSSSPTPIRKQAIQDAAGGQAAAHRRRARSRTPVTVRIEKIVPAAGQLRTARAEGRGRCDPVYQSIDQAAHRHLHPAASPGRSMLTLGISIIAGGLYGLLLTVGDPLTNVDHLGGQPVPDRLLLRAPLAHQRRRQGLLPRRPSTSSTRSRAS